MSYRTFTASQLTCDICHRALTLTPLEGLTEQELLEIAKRDRWKRTQKGGKTIDICWECRGLQPNK